MYIVREKKAWPDGPLMQTSLPRTEREKYFYSFILLSNKLKTKRL